MTFQSSRLLLRDVSWGVAGYLLMLGMFSWTFTLNPQHYTGYSILFSFFADHWIEVILLHIPIVLSIKDFTWKKLDPNGAIRVLVFGVVATLSYAYLLEVYNFFYGSFFIYDRLLLFGLSLLVCVRPQWIPLYLLSLHAIIGQYLFPVGGISMTDKLPLIRILFLMSACIFLAGFKVRLKAENVIIIALAIYASNYLWSGIAKLQMNWLMLEDISNLFMASTIYGWLHWLSADQIGDIRGLLINLNLPILLVAILIQVGCIFLFFSKRLFNIFSALLIMSHLMIFALSGILFWKWILLDIFFMIAINCFLSKNFFERKNNMVFLVLMVLAPVLLLPVRLAWFDTRYVSLHEFVAIDHEGKRHPLHPFYFRPYDLTFNQNRFSFLSDEKMTINTYGNTGDRSLALALGMKEDQALDYSDMESIFPQRNQIDPQKKDVIHHFLKVFIANKNHTASSFPTLVPRHIWTSFLMPSTDKIDELEIIKKDYYIGDDGIRLLNGKVADVLDVY